MLLTNDFEEEEEEEEPNVEVEEEEEPNVEVEEPTEGGGEETFTFTKSDLEKREKEIRKDQDARWKERVKKKDEAKKPEENDRMDRLELKAEGIKDVDAQDFVIDYAKNKGISLSEAMQSRAVKAELNALAEEAKEREATLEPSKRTGTPKKDVDYFVSKYEQTGEVPDDPVMASKVLDKLAAKQS